MKITKKYLKKLIEEEIDKIDPGTGGAGGGVPSCKGTKKRHSDGKCYYPDEMPCKGTKVRSKADGKCYYPDEMPDEKELNESLKIYRKKITQIIKEELQKIMEQSYEEYEAKDKKAIIDAITAGLNSAGIGLRQPPKVTDLRRYRGSGTGFTVEIETDLGAIKIIDK